MMVAQTLISAVSLLKFGSDTTGALDWYADNWLWKCQLKHWVGQLFNITNQGFANVPNWTGEIDRDLKWFHSWPKSMLIVLVILPYCNHYQWLVSGYSLYIKPWTAENKSNHEYWLTLQACCWCSEINSHIWVMPWNNDSRALGCYLDAHPHLVIGH